MTHVYKLFLGVILIGLFTGCTDETYVYKDHLSNGARVNDFNLVSPTDLQNIVLNSGTPNGLVQFNWEDTETGLEGTVRYSILFSDSEDFSSPLYSQVSDNEGTASTAGVKHQVLNDLFVDNNLTRLYWSAEARAGSVRNMPDQPFSFTVSTFGEGIKAFNLLAPENKSRLYFDKITDPSGTHELSWTKANSVLGAEVTYSVEFATTEDGFDEPFLSVPSDDAGLSRKLTFTNVQAFDLGLATEEYASGLYWRVVATADDFSYPSANTWLIWFEIFDVQTLYVLGDATSAQWNNNDTDPIELSKTGDGKFEKRVISLEAGKDIKFILTRGSWDVNWGGPDLGGNPVDLDKEYDLVSGGPNIKIPATAAGLYNIFVDFSTNKFRIEEFKAPDMLYLVGGSVVPGWDPSKSVPFVKFSPGVFEQYQYITVDGDGFKFLQVQDWAGDWGVDPNNPGKIIQEGESNVTVSEDGFYRIQVDFTADQNITLTKVEWGVIGDGVGGWSDSDEINMTFSNTKGDYIWKVENVTASDGQFKFRANDGWDINFGDTGADGSLEYGGENINISAGTYTIELVLDPVSGYTYNVIP